ncbi:bifunctional ornithine acetyltransferase/N-acetylglutamate synthase [Niallia endozanthoxylica]|uniref:Arginine biosynthesis bifunctional protein ArgJ n=1 Tax=Niallia endozanthoxylica TaxID=2036016 RepID=A0A5J5HXK0_9BACI|nr:bifunctional ornithine acetyltransferase/N-acetylglutamate synthase [Niallia endozanthoxylica]KAA9027538.1 bifunctional ornithine acetyltransferase/N-acetylglutamate synthase [Niallia endozanthoxylica]
MQAVSTIHVKEVKGGNFLTPKGFLAAGVEAGVKNDKKDVGIIISEVPANCAAVYTTNQFQAAPIKVSKESIAKEGLIQAVIVNSGCANACTGEQGLQDAYETRSLVAQKFNIKEHLIAVASTGVIGVNLPMEKIADGIKQLNPGNEQENAVAFQTAILTTDTMMKTSCFTAEINGHTVTMGGTAKGSGMIHPNMATMLAFITTDANVDQSGLQAALSEITETSFNQITVDGDTSTNDTVFVLANGKADHESLTPEHDDWPVFVELLAMTCESLAKQIARDGEGATKLIEVEVKGAVNDLDARMIAKQIVGSSLVKTAVYGADANWGRIISALGQTKTAVNTENVDISIGSIEMLKGSVPLTFSEEAALEYLQKDFIQIFVDLHNGDSSGKAWGCDLSYDYIKINASYRS